MLARLPAVALLIPIPTLLVWLRRAVLTTAIAEDGCPFIGGAAVVRHRMLPLCYASTLGEAARSVAKHNFNATVLLAAFRRAVGRNRHVLATTQGLDL
jgi:hypothetical protein